MESLSRDILNSFKGGAVSDTAFEELTARYSLNEVLIRIAELVYCENALSIGEATFKLKDVKALLPEKRDIKTVGTFSNRLVNGGVEKVVSLLTYIWCEAGYNVVLFNEEPANEFDFSLHPSVKRVFVPKITGDDLAASVEARFSFWQESIDKYSIDVMVYHQWIYEYLLADELAIKSKGVPLLLYSHSVAGIGFFILGSNARKMAMSPREAYSLCDGILTLSRADSAWWTALGIRNMTVINPSPFELDGGSEPNLSSKNILWVGRFTEMKQPYEAIKAIEEIRKSVPEAKLFIFGKGETDKDTADIEKYIEEGGLGDHVRLMGYRTDLSDFYADASLMLMTSRLEGFPVVVIESASKKIPIVAYDLPNIEVFRQNDGVTRVPQGEYKMLADAAVRLLTDDALLKEKSERIFAGIKAMYDKVDFGELWKKAFELPFDKRTPDRTVVVEDMSIEICEILKCVKEGDRRKDTHIGNLERINGELTALVHSKDEELQSLKDQLSKKDFSIAHPILYAVKALSARFVTAVKKAARRLLRR